jgi:hypothetical protein
MSDVSSDCHHQLCHRSSPPLVRAGIDPRQESDRSSQPREDLAIQKWERLMALAAGKPATDW